jgi:putative redox protein
MATVRLRRSGPRQLVGIDERHQTLVVDTAAAVGGEAAGLKPSELLPFGLAACVGVTTIGILEKQRLGPFEMTVDVEFDHAQERPKPFTYFKLHWQFSGSKLDEEKARKAVEMADERYCSVTASLKDSITIEHRVTVIA